MTSAALLLAGQFIGVITPINITAIEDVPAPNSSATAFVRLNSSGTITASGGTYGANWYSHPVAGIGNGYWCRMTKNSGTDPDSINLTTIYQLSSTREWSWSRSASGTTTSNVTLEIADDAAMAHVLASATFDVDATVTNGVLFFPIFVSDVETGVDAVAGYTFVGDGTVTNEGNSTSNSTGDWYGPDHTPGIGASYWVRCTNVSAPALTVGSYATWLGIGAGGGREFEWQRTTVGTSTGDCYFEFSTDSGGSTIVYTTGNVTVTVTKN